MTSASSYLRVPIPPPPSPHSHHSHASLPYSTAPLAHTAVVGNQWCMPGAYDPNSLLYISKVRKYIIKLHCIFERLLF